MRQVEGKPVMSSVEAVRCGVKAAREAGRPLGILFVCLGNICRSPAAQGVMERLVRQAGLSDKIKLDSAGFYGGHRGDLPDARMRSAAAARGLTLTHRSRTVRDADFLDFDIIIGMDDTNIDSLHRQALTDDADRKIVRMTDFAIAHPNATHVPDPYWEGAEGFELVLDMLEDACQGLLDEIRKCM